MIILGLGSNIGDRRAHLAAAVQQLREIFKPLRSSRLVESAALLPAGAPREWDNAFLNMAVCGETDMPPQSLLAHIKHMESAIGRQMRGHWAPREIDIDILAMDNMVFSDAALTIPHLELVKRDFALLPLAELAPDWRYPKQGENYGKTARELVMALGYKIGGNLGDAGML